MERASKLIRGLRLSGDVIAPEQLCCAAWPEAVGKKIAGHTRPAKLVRSRCSSRTTPRPSPTL
jgi:hypothetical protein